MCPGHAFAIVNPDNGLYYPRGPARRRSGSEDLAAKLSRIGRSAEESLRAAGKDQRPNTNGNFAAAATNLLLIVLNIGPGHETVCRAAKGEAKQIRELSYKSLANQASTLQFSSGRYSRGQPACQGQS